MREDGQDAIATRRYMDIKIADRLNEPAIQRDFLLGLSQRGRCGARINCVDLAAWKGNLSCVICKMRSALREQHSRLRARNDRDPLSRPRLRRAEPCIGIAYSPAKRNFTICLVYLPNAEIAGVGLENWRGFTRSGRH